MTTITDFQSQDKFKRLNADNYYDTFKLSLQMEDEIESKKILNHDQQNVRVKCVKDLLYSIELVRLSQTKQRMLNLISRYIMQKSTKFLDTEREHIRLWLSPMSMRTTAMSKNHEIITKLKEGGKELPRRMPYFTDRLYGYIKKVEGRTVYFELRSSLLHFMAKTGVNPQNESYFIRFMNDRVSITLQHKALDYVKDHKLAKYLFPSASDAAPHPLEDVNSMEIDWITELNCEQETAVRHILDGSFAPFPYVLFGPPGTGKTKTLVEAIGQIIMRSNAKEHIMVCATSNSACDEISKRLLELIPSSGIFRLFSRSIERKTDSVPDVVLQNSNLAKLQHYLPSLSILYQYKVLVCTLSTAGRLAQGRVSPTHFTHVFIDECGSATEPETLIAFAGVCSEPDRINAKVVLAGDPKQLGPVIMSSMAAELGLGKSLLITDSKNLPNEEANR